jgi:hypothetical protein
MQTIEDIPRVGWLLWIVLGGFLLPPTAVTFIGNQIGPFPHQTLWVILLGLPIPILLLSLPRKYRIESNHLAIVGLFYRLRVPEEEISAVVPVPAWVALVHPGSMFCSDPSCALKLVRTRGRNLIISPRNPEPFFAMVSSRQPSAHNPSQKN